MTVVNDASALLASLLDEPGRDLVDDALHVSSMSTVNVAEAVARLVHEGHSPDAAAAIFRTIALRLVAPDLETAVDAGALRAKTKFAGLSLGDRFCLALARQLAAPVLTADRDWLRVGEAVGVEIRLIR